MLIHMLKIAVCIHLLQLLVLFVFDLFLCLLTTAISFYALSLHSGFVPVCTKHHSRTWLGISFDSKHLYSCISLDMFYILLIVFICGFMERK
jgi:uncharacterized membrane protein